MYRRTSHQKETEEEYIATVEAVHDYNAQDENCLSFKTGDILYVIGKDASGWWDGVCKYERGWFPSNFTKVLEETASSAPKQEPRRRSNNIQLPPDWRVKDSQEGTPYFVNTRTNETTWSLTDVLERDKKKLQNIQPSQTIKPQNKNRSNSLSSTQVLDKTSNKETKEEINWDNVINEILRAISEFNQVAKTTNKKEFIIKTSKVAISVNRLLKSTRISEVQSSNELKTITSQHQNVKATLSKLIFSSKIASGIWPPPDAVNKMRFQAGQLLLSIRHFVSSAQEAQIQLQPLLNEEEFDFKETEEASIEYVARLDQYNSLVQRGVASLHEIIRENSDMVIAKGIEKSHEIITLVGQVLSLVEDLHRSRKENKSQVVQDFEDQKDILYTQLNSYIIKIQTYVEDPSQGVSIINLFKLHSGLIQDAIHKLVTTAKTLLEEKELMDQLYWQSRIDSMDNAANSNSKLVVLQRRAMSLTAIPGQKFAKVNISGNSLHEFSSEDDDDDYIEEDLYSQENILRKSNQLVRSYSESSNIGKSEYFEKMGGEDGGIKSDKITKFFGEDHLKVEEGSKSKLPFLCYEYRPGDITFNMEGQVNGGTIQALVERLTLHDASIDPIYFDTFMLTFRCFTTPMELADLLTQRFNLQPPPELTNDELTLWAEKKLTPIRLRVYNVFKAWFESFYLDEDEVVLDVVHNFASNLMRRVMPSASRKLVDLLNKRASEAIEVNKPQDKQFKMARSSEGIPRLNNTDTPPPSLFKKGKQITTVLDLDPLEVARQFTLIESRLFAQINAQDLQKQKFSKKSEKKDSIIKQMSSMSTMVTSWVAATILHEPDVKKRSIMIKHFVKIADRTHSLSNFNTLMSIVSALNSTTIERLKKTWELIGNKTRNILESMKAATDHNRNYAYYRSVLRRKIPPCLPFLGLYLTDLTFIDDGNPDYRDVKSKGNLHPVKVINFDKHLKTARIILEIQRFQEPYSFFDVAEIQEFLLFQINLYKNEDQTSLYNLSIQLEPREDQVQTGEKLEMMLQDEGLL